MTSLATSLVRGAVTSPFRRAGRPDATLPTERLTLPTAPGPLAAYRTICGFPEAEAGGGGEARDGAGPGDAGPGVLPLTYPHVLAFPLTMRLMTGRGFPLPVVGLVHTWFEACGHRAVRADEPIQLTVYAEELTAHRRGTEVTMVTEARVDGELVWESRSGYLSRHPTEAAAAGRREETDAEALPALREWRLPGDLGRRYGAVSGDRNPIHLHPLTARLFGFPRAIAHGMWTVARCLAEAEPDGPGHQLRTVRADFKAPVLLPATVVYAADPGGNAFALRSPSGRVHLTGAVTREA
ncbi:MaoC family dehydratase [Streptomyces bacillaris]|uniref:MaoC family dehydratase n=1 Tax=Streptomyces bacillaris TaxID=68179 RepID=UPI0035D5630E